MTTNAQVVQLFTDVLARWNEREAEFRNWQAGTAEGGPNADGRYPLTNGSDETYLVASPAKLASTVSGPAVLAQAAQVAAEAAQFASEAASTQANSSRIQAENFRNATLAARDLALLYRDQCAAAQAAVLSAKVVVEAALDTIEDNLAISEGLTNETLDARNAALVARSEAAIARDQAQAFAASINPTLLATKAELQSELSALVDAAPGTLNTLNEIAAALGDDPNFATTITNSVASKAPLVHTHVIADVTGLDTALAGKQPVGNYVTTVSFTWDNISGKPTTFAPSAHSHIIADVTGLQAALDSKQASGSYVTTANFTWTNLSGKPTTFTPSAHTHVIADVTGLQTALDGKQASGSYVTTANFTWTNLSGKPTTFAPTAHTHVIADVTGLQTALDGKQASLGFTPYNASNPAGYITSSALSSYLPLSGGTLTGNLLVPIAKSFHCFTTDYGIGTPDSNGLQIFAGNGDNLRLGHRSGAAFTERMRIDASGNVGIGTSSPSSKLDVNGVITGGNGTIRTVISYLADAGVTGTLSNHPYVLYANNAERMRIDASGNVSIGNTNAFGNKLYVNGNISASSSIRVDLGTTGTSIISTGTGSNFQVNHDGTSFVSILNTGGGIILAPGGTERMRIAADGAITAGGLGMARWTTAGQTSGLMTVSTASPSGGSDGDFWYKVAA